MQLELFSIIGRVVVDVEEWRECPGFTLYEVSSFGRFRKRETQRELRGTVAHNGYIHIGLQAAGKQVWKLAHRLVAEAFLERREEQDQVDHLNKKRADNRVANLEWVTRSENMKRAMKRDG